MNVLARTVAVLVTATGLAWPAAAAAAWIPVPSASGGGAARAMSAPAGTTPSVSVAARNVTATWTAPAGVPAPTGYEVRRAPSGGGSAVTPGGTCAGVVTSLSCTDANAPTGSWVYTVRPVVGLWRGAYGAASATAAVAAPGLSLAPATFAALPGTTTATSSTFGSSEALSFRLDSTSGTVLATTPATVTTSAAGAASATVTIPAGTSTGAHTVYAIGAASGVSASAAINVTAASASPTALTIVNGGVRSRQATAGDIVTLTFGAELRPSSICAAWPSTSTSSSTTGTVRLYTPSGGNNTLDVIGTTAAGCTFNFGSINLNRTDLLSLPGTVATFTTSTLAWTNTTRRIRLTLGTASVTGGRLTRAAGGATAPATYTPATAMLALTGAPVVGTFTTAPIVPF